MALETLRGLELGEFITVNHETNEITFKLQDGPVGEAGYNGCQVDALVDVAVEIISGLNRKLPCRENSLAITKLEEAAHWLWARNVERTARGVEGYNKA